MLDFFQDLASNDVFGGMLAAGAIGAVVFQLRALPGRIWHLFKSQFVAEVQVFDSDEMFALVNMWLGTNEACQKARRLRVVSHHSGVGPREGKHSLTPGAGFLLLKHEGKRFLFQRAISEPQQGSYRRPETITISTFARTPKPLFELFQAIRDSVNEQDTVPVRVWAGYASFTVRRLRRSLDTVYLADGVKENLVADIERFKASKDWYAERGFPWRRGYLLTGGPGVGKSSLIFALSCHFNQRVTIINLASIKDDNSLHEAFEGAGSDFIVLEDIDAVKVSKERRLITEDDSNVHEGITLSGLLNVVDGIAASEGRVIFMTTNHPDELDEALVRPGRVDLRINLEPADRAIVERMVRSVSETVITTERLVGHIESRHGFPVSQATVQNVLLEHMRDRAQHELEGGHG